MRVRLEEEGHAAAASVRRSWAQTMRECFIVDWHEVHYEYLERWFVEAPRCGWSRSSRLLGPEAALRSAPFIPPPTPWENFDRAVEQADRAAWPFILPSGPTIWPRVMIGVDRATERHSASSATLAKCSTSKWASPSASSSSLFALLSSRCSSSP